MTKRSTMQPDDLDTVLKLAANHLDAISRDDDRTIGAEERKEWQETEAAFDRIQALVRSGNPLQWPPVTRDELRDLAAIADLASSFLDHWGQDDGVDEAEARDRDEAGKTYQRTEQLICKLGLRTQLGASVMLECSTAHLQNSDNDVLDAKSWGNADLPLLCARFDAGYFVRTTLFSEQQGPDETDQRRVYCLEAGLSEAFCDFMAWAAKQGFSTVLFDADAPAVEGQPIFDW